MGKSSRIRNMGPKTTQWLNEIGVVTAADLRGLGIEAALQRLFQDGRRPSLNMAYALAAALLDCDWRELPEDERSRMVFMHDAAKRRHRGQQP
jgi:DNA transformation protein